MKIKKLKIPFIIIAIGLVVAVAAHFLTSVCKKPTITEQDFDFSITYKLDGETKTLNGVYTCRFDGFGADGIDPLDRYYTGEYTVNGVTDESRCFTIAQKDGLEIYIVALFNDNYLMGDKEDVSYSTTLDDPYFEIKDEEGYQYYAEEMPDAFDVEMIEWDYPDPIENSFVFAGFSGLHTIDMGAMLIVGLLTLVLCIILVKKSEDFVSSTLDVAGVVLNFIIGIFALPVISIVACLIQAFPTGPDWIYQMYLCIPPIIPFSLATSVSLRRKGFKKSGFCIQFLGIVILVILCILEYVL